MKKILIILTFLFLFSKTAHSAEWSYLDLATQGIVIGTLVVDWGQTLDIKNKKGHYETNVIMGKHPSNSTVHLYFTSIIIGHTVIAHYLPDIVEYLGAEKEASLVLRKMWQYNCIIIQIDPILNNYNMGLRLKF